MNKKPLLCPHPAMIQNKTGIRRMGALPRLFFMVCLLHTKIFLSIDV